MKKQLNITPVAKLANFKFRHGSPLGNAVKNLKFALYRERSSPIRRKLVRKP